jgi:Cu(I)/Ag(I) efflux system membrane fusion protein
MTMGFRPPPNGIPKDITVGATVNFEFRQSKDGRFEIVAISRAAK